MPVKHIANLSLSLFIIDSSVQDPGGPVPNLHVLVEFRDIFGEPDGKRAAKELGW